MVTLPQTTLHTSYLPTTPMNQCAWLGFPPMIPTDCFSVKHFCKHKMAEDRVRTGANTSKCNSYPAKLSNTLQNCV